MTTATKPKKSVKPQVLISPPLKLTKTCFDTGELTVVGTTDNHVACLGIGGLDEWFQMPKHRAGMQYWLELSSERLQESVSFVWKGDCWITVNGGREQVAFYHAELLLRKSGIQSNRRYWLRVLYLSR